MSQISVFEELMCTLFEPVRDVVSAVYYIKKLSNCFGRKQKTAQVSLYLGCITTDLQYI